MESFNETNPQPMTEQQRNAIYEMGKEFAFDGLTEEYFDYQSIEDLEVFRLGYQDGINLQQVTHTEEEKGRHK